VSEIKYSRKSYMAITKFHLTAWHFKDPNVLQKNTN